MYSVSLSSDTRLTDVAGSPHFLEAFPRERRGPIGQFFHSAVRHGATDPESVIRAVARTARDRVISVLQWGDARQERDDCEELLLSLVTHREAALAYAEEVITRQQLPSEEQARLKAEREEIYRREAMARKPATESQLAYLKQLGHDGPAPANREEASRWIDALLAEQEGRR